MKNVLIIGLGRFGRHLSMKMSELGNDVMVVDNDEEKVQDILPFVTNAQIADCSKEENLRSLGVSDFDICFVCVGANFQNSLEITSLLKELGATFVISKASRDIHEKFLLKNGADRVVYPEKNIAEKCAYQYSAKNVYDYIQLDREFSIYEVQVPGEWIGKSIRDIEIRVKYGLNIMAIKEQDEINPLPDPEHVFNSNEHVLVMGKKANIDKFLKKI